MNPLQILHHRPNWRYLQVPKRSWLTHVSRQLSTSTDNELAADRLNEQNDDVGYTLSKKQKRALKLPERPSDMTPNEILSVKLQELKRDAMIQDMEQLERKPQPWHNLLVYSSRALWRSSPNPPPPYLLNVQSDIIKASERTPKQLKRTHERIISNHISLSELRERERRRMVNGPGYAPSSIASKNQRAIDSSIQPVYYNSEQSVCSLKYRLVPNYSIMRRVLAETQSLLGKEVFQPRRVLDVGIGVGSASAAVLEFFHGTLIQQQQQQQQQQQKENRMEDSRNNGVYRGIEWIHGIDPSQSMRDASNKVLSSILEQHKSSKIKHANSTRITFGDSILSSSNRDGHDRSGGSFDLALCAYTLHEIPSVAASLSMAAILWEKLSPNGVAIFIEPGTPDGFNALRSIRNLLLGACPPTNDGDKVNGQEECHVIAPCTHNGTCPMVRHQRNFFRNKDREALDGVGGVESHLEGETDINVNDDYDVDDDDDEEDDDEVHSDFEDDEELGNEYEEQIDEEVNMEGDVSNHQRSFASETDVFNTAFCSFVHGMPGKSFGEKHGEKFSYLVVQKRIFCSEEPENPYDTSNPFRDISIVELLNQSLEAGNKKKDASIHDPKHLLERAIAIEDEFVNSDQDRLGLELVRGENRKNFGRIVRSPIKKKGHVIIDYCSSRVESDGSLVGRIVRSKVSRAQSVRYAPGMYSSARKSRWGGFWPDITQKETNK